MGVFLNYCAGASLQVLPAPHVASLLYNVPQNASCDITVRQTLQLIQAAGTKNVMGDSGGYQLLQKSITGADVRHDRSSPIVYGKSFVNLAPEHIIRANLKINPTAMTSLDLPIPKISDPRKQYSEFMKALGHNLVWMRETALLRKRHCPQIELYIPIQCYNLHQFETYIEGPLMDLEYDGVALPTRNLGPGGVTLFLLKFYQLGIRKIHILSESSFTGMALAAYFARHVFDQVSIDATSWRLQAERQVYMDPYDMHAISVNQNNFFVEGERPSCECPWCRERTFTSIKNMPLTDRTALVRCHNYHVVQMTGKDFYENAGDLLALEQHLRRRSTRKGKKISSLIRALTIATHMKDMDIGTLRQLLWND